MKFKYHTTYRIIQFKHSPSSDILRSEPNLTITDLRYILQLKNLDHSFPYHHIFSACSHPCFLQWFKVMVNMSFSITFPIGSMVLLYMVTWIPSIYPSYVSIYTSTMDPSWVINYIIFPFVSHPFSQPKITPGRGHHGGPLGQWHRAGNGCADGELWVPWSKMGGNFMGNGWKLQDFQDFLRFLGAKNPGNLQDVAPSRAIAFSCLKNM